MFRTLRYVLHKTTVSQVTVYVELRYSFLSGLLWHSRNKSPITTLPWNGNTGSNPDSEVDLQCHLAAEFRVTVAPQWRHVMLQRSIPAVDWCRCRRNSTLIVPKFFTEYGSVYLEQRRLESLSRWAESVLYVRFPGTCTWQSLMLSFPWVKRTNEKQYTIICNDFSCHWGNS